MPAIIIEGIARDTLSIEQNHALDILVNLSLEDFNEVKNILELSVEEVVGITTLNKFLDLCQELGFDLTENGVNNFKNSNQLGNTGVLQGVIGRQTAGVYFDQIKAKLIPDIEGNGQRHINNDGLDLVKEFEGLHKKRSDGKIQAYIDPVGVPTIGWGHTKGVMMGQVITVAEAEQLLKEDMEESESFVTKLVTVTINDNEFSALVSFVFNTGVTAFRNSTLLKLLNQGNKEGAADQFLRWNKGTVNGKLVVLEGLSRRRKAERKLFLS